MSYEDRHDVLYQECFTNFAKGHALYKDVSTARLKPGMCGYFDHDGDWQIVADLTRPDADLNKDGWTGAGAIQVHVNDNDGAWGAKHSKNVESFPVDIDVSADIPGVPVGIGFGISNNSPTSTGAVLIADGEVKRDYVESLISTRLKNWFVANAQKVLEKHEATRKRGIFVVTKTYHVEQRGVALLQSKQRSISVRINAELELIGKFAPEVGWWTEKKEEEWEIHSNPAGIVVFMSGWYWRPKWYRRKVKPTDETSKHKKLLGEGDGTGKMSFAFDVNGSEQELVDLMPEKVGE